jgi:poly [ADP-ribose] polymerase
MIEEAKSGRASCRTCRKPIPKGELRLGEEVPNAFAAGEVTHQWHHLPCAAKKRPLALEAALAETTLTVPDRAGLEAEIATNKKNQKPASFPYAERAKTSRSTCLSCSESIEKGTLRVAVEREVDTGAFVTSGAGYLHAACAQGWIDENAPDLLGTTALVDALAKNSNGLEPPDIEALKLELSA